MTDSKHISDNDTGPSVRIGRRVTWVGFWSNIFLAVAKILAGIYGRSSAMIADGVHSASDLATDVVVLVVIGASRRKEDKIYTYGHGKIETFASFVIALLLGAVGVGICADGASGVIAALRGDMLPRPGWIALAMAIVSIVIKEWLFHYTRNAARRINSSAMEANAWHHRSDSFSSAATLAGIAGAMFLGQKWRILDPVAAILVSVLIIVMAWRLGMKSVKELLEVSLPKEITDGMLEIIAETPGVMAFHRFRSRRNGSRMIVDLHVKVDPGLSVVQGHDIATVIEHRIKEHYGDVLVNVHIEPFGDPAATDRHLSQQS